MKKETKNVVRLEEKTLVNLLERFVENSPTCRTQNYTANQRFDPTSVTTKFCDIYMSKINDEEGYHLPDFKYHVTLTMHWGIEFKVEEVYQSEVIDPEEIKEHVPFTFKAYFDDGWCYGNTNDIKLDRGKKLNIAANDLILKILGCASYSKHIQMY